MSWMLQDVLAATAGVTDAGSAAAGMACPETFTAIATDSRRIEPGALFVALRGTQHDGHDFVIEALQRGAVAVMVDHRIAGVEPERLIRVADTLRALGDLAAWTRRQYPVRVVAVTGSNGKTTTKELIAGICAAADFPPPRRRFLKSEGNYNNLIGLPLTLLGLHGDEAVAVVEMGMNQPGEIARLTEIACPDYAVVTNVGPAHLEGVGGTLAGVAAAKGELFAGLSPEAVIAVNLDDEWVRRVAAAFPGRKVTFGHGGDVRAGAVVNLATDGVAFDLHVGGRSAKVRLRLIGAHNVMNALAAAAIGHAMGLSLDVIASGLQRATPPSQRMQIVRLANGVTLINDAYNANPSSVEAALEALRRLSGRPVVVLGDMRELGDESGRAHHTVGERAASLGVRQLFLFGAHAAAMAAGARAGGLGADAIHVCASHAEVAAAVVAQWQPGDCVLVKGSHGMRMDEVVRLLEGAGMSP
jgi:UDP-N-acetylmuramoyl-tripeptide--D-alanyl-D-alanine ligase